MNDTTVNTTLLSCGLALLPLNVTALSSDVYVVYTVRLAANALSCPLVILLNILVMVAVKTKRQLRTKSNIALACLATTDLVVGLVVQPLHIASYPLILNGETEVFCNLVEIAKVITAKCLIASFLHLFLMTAERYLAIKHPFMYENQVTEIRIMIASGVLWVAAIILPLNFFVTLLTVSLISFVFFPLMVYFNVAVYMEVRRNERHIATNQVSLEAKEKLLKNKKAFYTTIIVLFTIFLCYIPLTVLVIIVKSLQDSISSNIGRARRILYLVTLLPVCNSLFNPLIYAVRIRYFRVAFLELLTRKTTAQAEELERKIFGPRRIGVMPAAEQQEERAGRDNDEQRHGTLNDEHGTAVQEEIKGNMTIRLYKDALHRF